MTGWWDHLLTVADTNHDGKIDMDEFLALVDRLPTLRAVVTATADTVFDAVDESGDGRISRAEHRRLVGTWHGRSVETDDVFDLLDLDGDGYLSRSASALLWEQFWISADPSEPGTVMCGPHPGAVTALPAGGRRPTCVTRPPGGRPGPPVGSPAGWSRLVEVAALGRGQVEVDRVQGLVELGDRGGTDVGPALAGVAPDLQSSWTRVKPARTSESRTRTGTASLPRPRFLCRRGPGGYARSTPGRTSPSGSVSSNFWRGLSPRRPNRAEPSDTELQDRRSCLTPCSREVSGGLAAVRRRGTSPTTAPVRGEVRRTVGG
ncbi:EF-hand domain-containing protein [Kitasatospora sp. NPDC048298]|uniref:EF-hand domain-containing protein n=1 Tax=Kitasatospora sp. NPDC048298 TaxID=3364049 RepID=UPI003721FEA8